MSMRETLLAKIAENKERKAVVQAEAEAFLPLAESRPERALTVEEEVVFKALVEECKFIDKQTEELRERLDQLAGFDEATREANRLVPLSSDPMATRGLRPSGSPVSHPQGEAMRSIDAASRRGMVADAVAEVVTRSVEKDRAGGIAGQVAVLADPDYATAFLKYMQNPTRGHMTWTEAERQAFARVEEQRAVLSIGSNGGTALVPTIYDASWVLSGAGSISPFRNISRVERIDHGPTYRVPVVPQVTATYAASEGVEVTDASPTVGYKDVTMFSLRSFIVSSFELERDVPTLGNSIAMAFADAVNQAETTQFTLGDGTTEPEGIVLALDGGASEVSPATPEVFAIADVYSTFEALPARFRRNASWMSNLTWMNDIRQFGTAASHAFLSDLSAGNPPLMLGRPYHENSAMDDAINIAATADGLILLVGDFSRFCIVDSGPAEIRPYDLTGTTANYPTAQTGWLYFARSGSKCLEFNAFRLLNIATTA